MAEKLDINGMRARNWAAPEKIKASVKSGKKPDNYAVFAAVRNAVAETVRILHGASSDDRYRCIVDLIMMRIRAALGEELTAQTELAGEETVCKISDKIAEAAAEILEKTRKRKGSKKVSLPDAADSIIEAVVGAVDERKTEEQNKTPGKKGAQKAEIGPATENGIGLKPAAAGQPAETEQHIENKTAESIIQTADCAVTTLESAVQLGKTEAPTEKPKEKSSPKKTEEPADDKKKKPETPVQPARVLPLDELCIMELDKQLRAVNAKIQLSFKPIDERLKPMLKRLDKLKKALQPKTLIEKVIEFGINQVKTTILKQIFNPSIFLTILPDFLADPLNRINQILDNFKNTVSGLRNTIKNTFKAVRTAISRTFKAIYGVFKSAISGVFKLIRGAVRALWQLVRGGLTLLRVIGTLLFRAIGAGFRALWGLVPNGIKNFFKNVFGKIRSAAQRVGRVFKSVGKFFGKTADKIKNVFKTLKNCINKVKQKIVNTVKKIAEKAKGFFKKIIKKTIEVVKRIVKKIVQKIVQFFKKIVVKILKKLGISLIKKLVAKKAKKMGIKILVSWLKKFFTKLIAKIGTKLAAATGINAVPGLGQIISALMLIWTIVDVICTVHEIYTLFKDNPELWGVVKQLVAEWAEKAFNFIKDLCALGKKLFLAWVGMCKNIGHAVGDALFSSNKQCNELKERQMEELRRTELESMRTMVKIPKLERLKMFYENIVNYTDTTVSCSNLIVQFNKKIADEDDSWWRDMDLIMKLLSERHELYLPFLQIINCMGWYVGYNIYNENIFDNIRAKLDKRKTMVKSQIEQEEYKQKMALLNIGRINYIKLGEFMKEKYEKYEQFKKETESAAQLLEDKYKEGKDALQNCIDECEDAKPNPKSLAEKPREAKPKHEAGMVALPMGLQLAM